MILILFDVILDSITMTPHRRSTAPTANSAQPSFVCPISIANRVRSSSHTQKSLSKKNPYFEASKQWVPTHSLCVRTDDDDDDDDDDDAVAVVVDEEELLLLGDDDDDSSPNVFIVSFFVLLV